MTLPLQTGGMKEDCQNACWCVSVGGLVSLCVGEHTGERPRALRRRQLCVAINLLTSGEFLDLLGVH